MTEERFAAFAAIYREELTGSMSRSPEDYGNPAEWTAEEVSVKAATVAEKMLKTIREHGVGRVNINTASFRSVARRLGIRPTYKAISGYLAGRD